MSVATGVSTAAGESDAAAVTDVSLGALPTVAYPLAPQLLHGGAPAGTPPHAAILAVAVVALGLLAWCGTVALDTALARLE